MSKNFNPSMIGPNSVTTLTFIITNSINDPSQSGIGFSDTLPAGLQADVVFSNTCNGNTMISADKRTITLVNGQLTGVFFGSNSCAVKVSVKATGTCGMYQNNPNNFTNASNLSVSNVNAALTVSGCQPPVLTKVFVPPTIGPNGTSSVTFTISNPTGATQSGIAFIDTLPAGLIFGSVMNPGCSANLSVSADRRSFIFNGGQFSGTQQTCQIVMEVKPTGACGVYTNNASNFTGVQNLNLAVGNQTLDVSGCASAPPALTKAFVPPTIGPSGTSVLTFTITNSSGDPSQGGIAFSDALPAGLVVDGIMSQSCLGALSFSGDNRTILWNGGQLAAGQHACQIVIKVKGTGVCGIYKNIAANFSNVANLNVSSASAQLEVAQCQSGLTLRKVMKGAPAVFQGQFPFLVQCTTPQGFYQKTVSVDWPTPGFIALNDVPAGSECTITEGPLPSPLPAGYNWSGLPQYDPAAPVTVTGASEVTITNTLLSCNDTGKVTVRKIIQGLPANYTGVFEGTLQCWTDGNRTTFPIVLTAPAALTAVVPSIAHGSVCTFVETTQPSLTNGGQWDAPIYAPPFGTVTLDDACCKEIIVTNQARTCCTVDGVTTCVVAPATPP